MSEDLCVVKYGIGSVLSVVVEFEWGVEIVWDDGLGIGDGGND